MYKSVSFSSFGTGNNVDDVWRNKIEVPVFSQGIVAFSAFVSKCSIKLSISLCLGVGVKQYFCNH